MPGRRLLCGEKRLLALVASRHFFGLRRYRAQAIDETHAHAAIIFALLADGISTTTDSCMIMASAFGVPKLISEVAFVVDDINKPREILLQLAIWEIR